MADFKIGRVGGSLRMATRTDECATWYSSDTGVFTVSDAGPSSTTTITATGVGTAVLSCTVLSAECGATIAYVVEVVAPSAIEYCRPMSADGSVLSEDGLRQRVRELRESEHRASETPSLPPP